MEGWDRGIFLLCLLSLLYPAAFGASEPALQKTSNNAWLQWRLPSNISGTILNVALKTTNRTLNIFFADLAKSEVTEGDRIKARLEVLGSGLNASPRMVTFTLSNVTAADAGHYICIEGFGNTPVIDDCGQMLVVVDKPTNPAVQASTAAVENQDLTLKCVANSTSHPLDHGLPLQVQWFDSNDRMLTEAAEEKVMVAGESLVVRSVRREDKGLRYSCRAQHGLDLWSERSAPYSLIPEYGPTSADIKKFQPIVPVNEHKKFQQNCTAVCNPDCSIVWEKQHQTQGDWYNISTQRGLLNITSVQRNEGGQYRCLATNKHGRATRPLTIDVRYAPNVQTTFVDTDVKKPAIRDEHNNVTLKCVFDSNPAPVVTWRSQRGTDGELFIESLESQVPQTSTNTPLPQKLFMSELVLTNLKCSDTDTYICAGRNDLGLTSEGTIDLDVRCMPRNSYGELTLKPLYLCPADETFSVKFQVEAFPSAKILRILSEDEEGHRRIEERGTAWSYNVETLESHRYLATYDLRFLLKPHEYFDRTYYLYLENNQGEIVMAFMLRERGAPKPPKNVTVLRTGSTEVGLTWTPGFDGGKPQEFIISFAREKNDDMEQHWTVHRERVRPSQSTNTGMTLDALDEGTTYTVCVRAVNEYGNSSCSTVSLTTSAITASSAVGGGTVAGIIIAVVVVIIIVVVIVYILVLRPRRNKHKEIEDEDEHLSKKPMLDNGNKAEPSPVVQYTNKKAKLTPVQGSPKPSNNNAPTDLGTEHLVMELPKPPVPGSGTNNRPRNQDGLIYAELDLAKARDSKGIPQRVDAVNYETIDFTRKPPLAHPDPDVLELASDEEDLPFEH